MKNLFLLLILSSSVCYGQQDSLGYLNNKTGEIEKGFGIPPVFPGCEKKKNKRKCFEEKMARHISKNLQYPKIAIKERIQGRVYVFFIIDTDGSVTRIRARGRHKILEMEAYRIITKLPKMTPGKIKGIPVRIPFSVPITFRFDKPKPKPELPLNTRMPDDRVRPPL